MSYSIRFDWLYNRRQREWVVDTRELTGARACAARMICSAWFYRCAADRDRQKDTSVAQRMAVIGRLQMQQAALWARVFAGQIAKDDARLQILSGRLQALVLALHESVEAVA